MAATLVAPKKDLEFLLNLDKKLHTVSQSTFTPNISGSPFPGYNDSYTDASMTKAEIEKVLKICESNGFILYPTSTAFGLAVGFGVADIVQNSPLETERFLAFAERQLPKGYDFKRLSEYFMKPTNLKLAQAADIKIINNRSRYDYKC